MPEAPVSAVPSGLLAAASLSGGPEGARARVLENVFYPRSIRK